MFDKTYQATPKKVVYEDIYDQYSRSLARYRHDNGIDPDLFATRSYFAQNSRGLMWVGIVSLVSAAAGVAFFMKANEAARGETNHE